MSRGMRILAYVFFACLVGMLALVFHRFAEQNHERIQNQNRIYGEDAARQTARRVDTRFQGAQELIRTYAAYLGNTLAEPHVTARMLKAIEEKSPFDAIRFTNPQGMNFSSSGQITDTTDREFYLEGMKGKSGVTVVYNSRVFHQTILGFYTPIHFQGKIVGVLHGTYLADKYLPAILKSYYFDAPAEVFLCGKDGRVIASANDKKYEGNILDVLEKKGFISQETVAAAEKIFKKGGEGAFVCNFNPRMDNLSVVHLENYNFVLVQSFPKKVTQRMIANANQAGVRLEISILAIFACYLLFLLIRWRLQRKRLEKDKKLANSITKGMANVFASRYCMADLEKGTYSYIAGLDPAFSGDLPNDGSYEDLLRQHTSALQTPREREDYYNYFKLESIIEKLSTRDLVTYECHVWRSGREAWENCIASCTERVDGRPTKVIYMRQDITESRLREKEAARRIAIMNRKESQYRQAVASSALCSFEFNVSKNLISEDVVSDAGGPLAAIFRISGQSLPCKATQYFESILPHVLPESRESYQETMNPAYFRNSFAHGTREVDFDYWISTPDGKEACLRQSFYLNMDEMSGDIMAMSVARDITEQVIKQRAQTKALQDALMQAQHANKAKTTFLTNMSHDIRTPMNAIIGFASIAASHLDNREQVEDCLKKVLSSSNHLLSLINDILDMSRIESGKLQIKEKECNLSELMHSLVNIIQPQVTAKQMQLFMDTFGVSNEDVLTDPLKLNQIFINLLGNAVKYTATGGSIYFSIGQKPAFRHGYADYVFIVRDNGIGMSEEFVRHIFEPFTREVTTTQSGIQGTGLGMAITKNIVEMMGGSIDVQSAPGKGSTFTVTLTLKVVEGVQSPEKLEKLKGLRALVVDDDFHVCDSVSKMFKSIGLRSEWTTSGREAIYRAQIAHDDGDPYNTYIIDWQMPGMNGVETARGIRRIVGEETPIIILTAYDWADIEEDARAAGVTAFCAKPLFMSDLRHALLSSHNLLEAGGEESDRPGDEFVGRRVLLVDDVELNRELAEFILTEYGFIVETAPDGTDAVDMVKKTPENYYDAILMDVQMPTMNGYEATRVIRGLPRKDTEKLPIIAMTANALEDDKAAALQCGMNAHIAKPIDIKKFLEVLRRFIK